MWKVQCFSCKEFGHIVAPCSKKSCNYYKKPCHIIKECPIHPQNCQAHAYQDIVGSSSFVGPFTARDQFVLTPEMVQQIIRSTLGLQGNGTTASQTWLVDSATSNHMTRISDNTLQCSRLSWFISDSDN